VKVQVVRLVTPPLLVLVAIGILWELATRMFGVPEWLLPAPSVIWVEFSGSLPQLLPHTVRTLVEVGLGYGISLLAAFVVAGILEQSKVAQRALYPLLVTSQAIPVFALAPLLAIWFGFGILPKVLIVALVCFFPIAISLAGGLRGADPDMVALLRSMDANARQVFFKVKWPSALPGLLSGMKIAASYSVIAAVIAEWIGASQGLGLYMLRASNSFQTARVFAAIGVVAVLSIVLFLSVDVVGRLIAPWTYVPKEESST
jgi:ABC-type nitrate/sulfonate/bicarbonate transport system permease component